MLDVTNLHIKAGAYDGDVFIRSYAYLRISTDAARSSAEETDLPRVRATGQHPACGSSGFNEVGPGSFVPL
jgi:hypothetical protein